MASISKKKGPRYDGKDNQPWVVKDSSGKRIAEKESHEGFKTANAAAKRFTEATGEYAAAARA